MSYKEKLRELLYEVPEIKKDLEKLKTWTIIKHKIDWDIREMLFILQDETHYLCSLLKTKINNVSNQIALEYKIQHYEKENWNFLDRENFDIENPIEERFIRMYCENKWLLTMYKNELQFNYANISVELDDTKAFDNQYDLVYQKIYEALLELN